MKQSWKLPIACFLVAGAAAIGPACAQEPVKIGLPMPLTGGLSAAAQQAVAGARLYMTLHGDTVAGRKVRLIVQDDTSVPDVSKRIAQEMIVNDKVDIIGGGLTPNVLAIAPLVTEAKKATVIMVSGTSFVIRRSDYFVRTSWTHGQQASVLADWAAKSGSKRVTIVSSDGGPGDVDSGVLSDYH